MAGNGQFSLQLASYPSGIDKTLRTIVLKGNALSIVATTGTWINVTAFAIVTNVLTLTAVNSLTTGGGQVINVTGFSGANVYLNGQYTTTSATATTIVMAKTHANASGTAAGLVTVAPTYQTGGLPISLNFINFLGQQRVVGGIGPLSTIKWIDFKTVAGSALNYKLDLTGAIPLLLVFSGITQATDAAAVPFDTVAFRAEFTSGGF